MLQPRRHRSAGQATVEFALVAPLVVMCVIALIATLSLSLSTLELNDLARTIARSAITSDAPADTAQRFAQANNAQVVITTLEKNGLVTIEARRIYVIPIIGNWLPRLTLRSRATMMREPPFVLD